MESTVLNNLGEYGIIGVVLALCLLYIWNDKKSVEKRIMRQEQFNQDNHDRQNKVMEMVAESNKNVAEVLVCLRMTLDNSIVMLKEYGTDLKEHNEMALLIKEDVKEIKVRIETFKDKGGK